VISTKAIMDPAVNKCRGMFKLLIHLSQCSILVDMAVLFLVVANYVQM